MKTKTITRDKLWTEFKKAIDSGHYTKFKTRRGMDGYLNRLIKKHCGKSILFIFSPGPYQYRPFVYNITKEDVEIAKS